MSKKFKWTLLAMLFASVLLVMTACGGKDSSKGGDNKGGGDGKGDTVTLQVGIQSDYIDYVKDIAPKFEEEHNVKIEIVERDMFETLEALPLDGPANLAPDVMIAPYDRIGNLGQQGHLAEVTLPSDGRYADNDAAQVTINGKAYGYPMVIEALVMYYNKDLVDQAPATFKDLEALAEDSRFAFKDEAGKSTAFLANWLDFYYAYGLIAGYDGYVFGNNGTDPSDIGLNTDGAVEALEYAVHWYQNIWPQGMLDASTAGNFVMQMFTEGKAAAMIGGPWNASDLKEAGINYGVAAIPTLPNGQPYSPFGGGKGWIISNYSKHKDVAEKWLEYVTNAENQMKLYEATGEIPANADTKEQILAGDDELAKAVINVYSSAVPMPNIPQMAEVWEPAKTMFFDAVAGNKDAKTSADDQVEVIKQNIEQKY